MATNAHIPVRHIVLVVISINRNRGDVRSLSGEGRRSVPVMKVQVDDCGALQFSRCSHRVHCYHESVECAKALAMIGVRVMKPTHQRGRATVPQGPPPGCKTTAAHQAHGWE